MKKIVLTILIIIAFITLAACGDTAEYKDDVTVDEIADSFNAVITNASIMTKADESFIALNFDIDTSLCDEYVIYIPTSSNADHYGVFKANSKENVDKLVDDIEAYLQMRRDTWMSEYLPEEYPKVENAVCKTAGLYVTFLVLDDTSRSSSVAAFNQTLSK